MQLARREGTTAPDRIRFLFTGLYTGAGAGAASQEGLEGMRLTAVANDKVNVGIGDFYAAGVGEPAERLDVVDGKVRIRQLPSDAVSTSDEVVTVNMTTGVLEHRPVPSGCIWNTFTGSQHIQSGLGNPGTAGANCPDRGWLYTIGAAGTLGAKLSLYQNSNERNVQTGLNVHMVTNPNNVQESYGIRCDVQPLTNESSNASHGVWSRLANPKGSYGNGVYGTATKSNTAGVTDMSGVRGLAQVTSTGSASSVHGVYGETILQGPASSAIGATGRASISFTSTTIPESIGMRGQTWSYGSTVTNAYGGRFTSGILYNGTVTNGYGVHGLSNNGIGTLTNSYGVYGIASGGTFNAAIYGDMADTTGAKWAGYFRGKVRIDYNAYVNGNVLVTSDATLKTNVEDITNASELVQALQPKTYDFIPQQHPHMIMPQGRQWGLLAQDLQEVIPELVERVPVPAQYDSTGTMIADATSHLAVNYNGLIPVLIAAMKEQNDRIDDLEQALAACCSNPDGSRMLDQGLNQPNELDGSLNGSEKLRIQPNPFNERTTVFYTLDRGGRTQLLANSSDGRDLRVLQEANLEAGSYQFDWNTAALAPGMYYVTLLLDGQPVVKKAVKVDR
ncbi:MAG: tail fiber domain-containing protein [Flavobacteriales bacterium]